MTVYGHYDDVWCVEMNYKERNLCYDAVDAYPVDLTSDTDLRESTMVRCTCTGMELQTDELALLLKALERAGKTRTKLYQTLRGWYKHEKQWTA